MTFRGFLLHNKHMPWYDLIPLKESITQIGPDIQVDEVVAYMTNPED